MLIITRDTVSTVYLPLLEGSAFDNNGYLFKLTNSYTDEVTYNAPTVTDNNTRLTTLEITADIIGGQYLYRVYNFDADNPTPTDEIGLTELAVGRLLVIDTTPSNVYL